MKSIHIVEPSLPRAWEQAVLACWNEGEPFTTQYDRPGQPPSRDVVAMIHVTDPFAEPRIHRAFPGGLDDLAKYCCEVLQGVHDHWIDPAAGKWEYTYHQRLRQYDVPGRPMIDQLAAAVERLRAAPHTRRAQAVTWQAWLDPGVDDPPCLQRLWLRVEGNRLNMTCHMRSNDAFKAAFMNMYAFCELQRSLAAELGLTGGQYVHIADSFHIYGSDFPEFEGFTRTVQQRQFEQRVYTDGFAIPMFLEGLDVLLKEPDMPEAKKDLVRARRKELEGRLAASSD